MKINIIQQMDKRSVFLLSVAFALAIYLTDSLTHHSYEWLTSHTLSDNIRTPAPLNITTYLKLASPIFIYLFTLFCLLILIASKTIILPKTKLKSWQIVLLLEFI